MLSQLPRTRPQRPSARRAASRRAGQAGGRVPDGAAPAPKAKRAKSPQQRRPKGPRRPRRKPPRLGKGPPEGEGGDTGDPPRPRRAKAPADQPVPRQGFESESDRARGPVRPPGGTELLTSAAEIVGELTKAGFSTGERLLRSLLPRS